MKERNSTSDPELAKEIEKKEMEAKNKALSLLDKLYENMKDILI